IVSHQRWKIEGHRQASLTVLEKKLESLVRVARAPETGELAHRPQFAAIAGGVNAARVRIRSRYAERLRALRRHVERRVQRIDVLLRVHEGDIAKLALLVAASPLGDFGAQAVELAPLLAAAVEISQTTRRRHINWLRARVTRSALRSSSSSATANGLVCPASSSESRPSSQRLVASSRHSRRRPKLSTTSMTRWRSRDRRRSRSVPLRSR